MSACNQALCPGTSQQINHQVTIGGGGGGRNFQTAIAVWGGGKLLFERFFFFSAQDVKNVRSLGCERTSFLH